MDKSKSDKSLAEELIDLFIQAKTLARDSNDWLSYKEFLLYSKRHWMKFYLECTTDAGRGLVAEILKTTKNELKWVDEKLAESKVPF